MRSSGREQVTAARDEGSEAASQLGRKRSFPESTPAYMQSTLIVTGEAVPVNDIKDRSGPSYDEGNTGALQALGMERLVILFRLCDRI